MTSYYSEKLAAERLALSYEIAPPAVQRYLRAEISEVARRIAPGSRVLELGCGYGRVLKELATTGASLAGVDLSLASLAMARRYLENTGPVALIAADAARPAFRASPFDLVFCIQNGISAFRVDPRSLLEAAIAVTRPGGRVLFSTYASEFWEERHAWFRLQASRGLIGEIDEEATGDGVIVCRDGFRATTLSLEQFRQISSGLGRRVTLTIVDGSSLFCEIDL